MPGVMRGRYDSQAKERSTESESESGRERERERERERQQGTVATGREGDEE